MSVCVCSCVIVRVVWCVFTAVIFSVGGPALDKLPVAPECGDKEPGRSGRPHSHGERLGEIK